MNILVFAHDAYLYGASQSLLTALIGIKKRAEVKLLVLLPFKGAFEKELSAAGIHYKIIAFPRCVDFNYASDSDMLKVKNKITYNLKSMFTLPRLKKIARAFHTDVIYTNTSVVSIGYQIAKQLHIPHVWHIREFGDLDFNLIYYSGRVEIERKVNDSERTIFASLSLKNHWSTQNSSQQVVVYNGIMKDNDKENQSRSFPVQKVRIGLLGSIVQGKGQHVAIQAFASLVKVLPSCELYFFGDPDGEYLNSLKRLVNKLQLNEKININGFTNDKNFIYSNLHVVLSCSTMEAFGRTIVEAMGYGIPVIANASGGVLEIIDHRINGLLYDGTSENLAAAMIELLSNKNLYESLSINGLQKAREFRVGDYVDGVYAILCDAVSSNNPSLNIHTDERR